MLPWVIKAFSGEQPRISPNLLPPNAAQEAVNVRLDDGALTPLRRSQQASSFPGYPGGFQTIYRYQDEWLGWTSIVHAVPGPVAQDRLYITGDGVPKMRVGVTVYDLKVPFPTNKLTAALPANEQWRYRYSYVDEDGTESEAGPLSPIVEWNSNRKVRVSGFEDVPAQGAQVFPDWQAVSAVDDANDRIDFASAHGFETGDPVEFQTSGTFPTGIEGDKTYYAFKSSTTAIKIAESPAKAAAQEFIAIANDGTGTLEVRGEPYFTKIKKQKLYRIQEGSPDYFLVGERAASTQNWIDAFDGTATGPVVLPVASDVDAPATAPDSAFDFVEVPATRLYVYTYVTGFGEESEPCPASDPVEWEPGQDVTLSGFAVAPAGRNVTKQRIYRTQTGNAGTDLYFIAERSDFAVDFVDDLVLDDFAEPLPSRAYNQPPDGLSGLVAMPNGMMAGFVGRDIYFCVPWQPHAWPEAYVLSTDTDIVALAAIGTALIILTKGTPYLARGTEPSAMQMVKIETNMPCINARGVQDLGFGIAYPSHEGLALITAGGQVGIATANVFSREDWERFNPETICSGQLSGRYVASFNSLDEFGDPLIGTFIIELSGAAFFARSDVEAEAFYFDTQESALYFLKSDGNILRFDHPSADPINMYWKSKPLLLPYAVNFGVIQIDGAGALGPEEVAAIEAQRDAVEAQNQTLLANPLGSEINGAAINTYAFAGDSLLLLPPSAQVTTVGVYADDKLVASINTLGEVKRLPSGFLSRRWHIDVFGTAQIHQISIARTASELRMVAPS